MVLKDSWRDEVTNAAENVAISETSERKGTVYKPISHIWSSPTTVVQWLKASMVGRIIAILNDETVQ